MLFVDFFCIVLAIVLWLSTVGIIPEFIMNAAEQIADTQHRKWPIAWGFHPEGVHSELPDSIHIATIETELPDLMANPVAFLPARVVSHNVWLDHVGKLILVSSHSVNILM